MTAINVSRAGLSATSATLPAAMGDLIGYARVSTAAQDPVLQLDALAAAGCARVFCDEASGALAERPELARTFDHLRAGDTLVVWRLDRLGRSLRHLIDTIRELYDVAGNPIAPPSNTILAASRACPSTLGPRPDRIATKHGELSMLMSIGPMEIIVVLARALLILGPKRLPEAGKSIGRGIR